jgi:hypothetical protein
VDPLTNSNPEWYSEVIDGLTRISVYSTGVNIDALMLFLAIVATEDLDLWKLDVKTALSNMSDPHMAFHLIYYPRNSN